MYVHVRVSFLTDSKVRFSLYNGRTFALADFSIFQMIVLPDIPSLRSPLDERNGATDQSGD